MSVRNAVALAVERTVQPVEGMHRAIAAGWFEALGRLGKSVRLAHDAIAGVVYGSIRLGGAAVGLGLDAALAVDGRTADSVEALVTGLWGDARSRHEDVERPSMSIRDGSGSLVPLDPELIARYPAATGRLVVLVHGLIRTERCWHGTAAEPGLFQTLKDDPALTPVAVRYNTGLEVAANGAALASLLEGLHASWPTPVRSIALVGHSMGGLVIRSACTAARDAGHRWIDDVSDVVTIGSPHRGAPLEKLVNAVAWSLHAAPQTRPLADFLNTRSRGIKDLRHGIPAVDRPGRIGAGDEPPQPDITVPPNIRHHFVAGVITANPAHPFGAVVGDLMVRPTSSTAAPRLDPTNVVVLGGVHHFDLVHDPAVIDWVMDWLHDAT